MGGRSPSSLLQHSNSSATPHLRLNIHLYILSVYIYFSITQFAPDRSSIVSLPLRLLLPLKLVYIFKKTETHHQLVCVSICYITPTEAPQALPFSQLRFSHNNIQVTLVYCFYLFSVFIAAKASSFFLIGIASLFVFVVSVWFLCVCLTGSDFFCRLCIKWRQP